ncbi:hypothetical protein [Fodinicola feengrottensis]|uniref:hypothetical protein n=1 Tax=Fodinicola feengrottensis TaxID=435914 RepID=UPI0024435F96|nr:hypothetical protein [Fodinicola feengrottensis]
MTPSFWPVNIDQFAAAATSAPVRTRPGQFAGLIGPALAAIGSALPPATAAIPPRPPASTARRPNPDGVVGIRILPVVGKGRP